MSDRKFLGLDFGTRRCGMAVYGDGRPELVAAGSRNGGVSSIVARSGDGQPEPGQPDTEPVPSDRRARSAKRLLVEADLADELPEALRPVATVLRRVKTTAEERLGTEMPHLVMAVPTRLSVRRRKLLADVAEVVGFSRMHPLDETTAAVMAYGHGTEANGTVLAMDVGARTVSTSLVDINGGAYEVLATTGELHFGGDDWDEAVVDWAIDRTGVETVPDSARSRLREQAERAKRDLAVHEQTEVTVPTDGRNRQLTLTRSKFEHVTTSLTGRLTDQLRQVCSDAGVTPQEIDEVVLTGQTARLPQVRSTVTEFAGSEPTDGIDPETAVARGIAVQAGVYGGRCDDVVALPSHGTAIGIRSGDGAFQPVLEQDVTFPTSETVVGTTSSDDASAMRFDVYQGNRDAVTENELIGSFRVAGLPSAPSGKPDVELSFHLDERGLLHVDAEETALETATEVTVEGDIGLSDRERKELETWLTERDR
ncbi:Hsp70 family protein [Halosimplex halophilum]|uniref:Hsp70 family protein n=1 Tax=Halosimplex halophilum TaxID=2559572 RepID=UPI001435532F|nr:Hsp70 family protein [Halosimplex halophilum]